MPSEKDHIDNIKMQALATLDPVKKNSAIDTLEPLEMMPQLMQYWLLLVLQVHRKYIHTETKLYNE